MPDHTGFRKEMVTKNLRKVSSVMVMTVTPNTKNVTLLIVVASWLFGMLEFSFMLVIPRLLESFFSLPPFPWLIKWSPLWGKTNIPYSFVVIICPTFSHSFLMKTINIWRWAEPVGPPQCHDIDMYQDWPRSQINKSDRYCLTPGTH